MRSTFLKLRTVQKPRSFVLFGGDGGFECSHQCCWINSLVSHFSSLRTVSVDGYKRKIPEVLHKMRSFLLAVDAWNSMGDWLFSTQPDPSELLKVKQALNAGTFSECKDVSCVATLFKQFFSELPEPSS